MVDLGLKSKPTAAKVLVDMNGLDDLTIEARYASGVHVPSLNRPRLVAITRCTSSRFASAVATPHIRNIPCWTAQRSFLFVLPTTVFRTLRISLAYFLLLEGALESERPPISLGCSINVLFEYFGRA